MRGGHKGGSANSQNQFEARQKVGLTYGRQTGMRNQSNTLKEIINKYIIWEYSKKGCFEYFLTEPKSSAIEIIKTLNIFIPNSIPSNAAPFYKVLKKERPGMYDWKLMKMLTRSEIEEGIKNLKNPVVFEDNKSLKELIQKFL